MNKVNESTEATQSGIDKPSRVQLPNFPDEYTSPHWVWPPLTGYDILQVLLKHTLRPRPRQEGMWVITVQDEWRCFSKIQWHYTDPNQAREAFRSQIGLHLQGSPILSTQRCIAVAQGRKNRWYLWQIVHEEPSLATHFTTALQSTDAVTLTATLLKWVNFYVTIYQQCSQYPLQLDLSMDNVGVNDKQSFIYLGPIEAGRTSPSVMTDDMIKQVIKQVFSLPILKNLSIQIDVLQQILISKQSTEQDIILTTLIELLSDIKEG